jgi:hypothetical protein
VKFHFTLNPFCLPWDRSFIGFLFLSLLSTT